MDPVHWTVSLEKMPHRESIRNLCNRKVAIGVQKFGQSHGMTSGAVSAQERRTCLLAAALNAFKDMKGLFTFVPVECTERPFERGD